MFLEMLVGIIGDFLFHFWLWGGDLRLRRSDYLTQSPITNRARKRGLLFGCVILLLLVALAILALKVFA